MAKKQNRNFSNEQELDDVGQDGLIMPSFLNEDEPTDPDPIVRKDWEKSTNTMPNDKALKEDGTLKMGTGVRGTYATVANDGVIELSLIPMIPGRKILGPAGDEDIYTKTEEGDVSCFFGVTSLEHPLKDVIGLYDSITLDVISDGEIIQTMDLQLHNDGWFDKNGEMLEGTYIDEYTIQEATRVSFYVERGKEHKFVLSANSKENNESIEVTVIDEYVDPEVPVEPEEPEVPIDPEVPVEPTDPEEGKEPPIEGVPDPEEGKVFNPEDSGCYAKGDTVLEFPALPEEKLVNYRAEVLLYNFREAPSVMPPFEVTENEEVEE